MANKSNYFPRKKLSLQKLKALSGRGSRENLVPIIIPKIDKGKYINFLANEDSKNFTKWALELQKKELERIELFKNNQEQSKENEGKSIRARRDRGHGENER